jgi:hypothetical protein
MPIRRPVKPAASAAETRVVGTPAKKIVPGVPHCPNCGREQAGKMVGVYTRCDGCHRMVGLVV